MYGNVTTTDWHEVRAANVTEEVEIDPELVRFQFVLYAVVVPILFSLITVVGLAGNSLVVYAVSTRRRMRTVTNLLLLNLAVADLCFVIVVPPFTAYESVAGVVRSSWALGEVGCRLLHYLVNVTAYVTVYTLAMIAAVRYATIVHGARTARWRTRATIARAIVGLWVVVMTVNIPILRSYSVTVKDGGIADCNITDLQTGQQIFSTLFVFAYVLPLSVIGALSALILAHISKVQRSSLLRGNRQSSSISNTGSRRWHSGRFSGRFGLSRGPQNDGNDVEEPDANDSLRRSERAGGPRPSSRKRQVTQLLVLVVVVFALLWLPIHVHLLLGFFYQEHMPDNSKIYMVLGILWQIFAYFNSCVNPIIYNHTSKDFRDAFVSVVGCLCRGRCGLKSDGGIDNDVGRNGGIGVGGIAAAAAVVAAPVELHEVVCLTQSQQHGGGTSGAGNSHSAKQAILINGDDDYSVNDEDEDSPERRQNNLAVLGRLRPVMMSTDGDRRMTVPVVIQLQEDRLDSRIPEHYSFNT